MQGHYNEHCLGLGRQALILHGSHRELGPFRAAEDPCYHSPSEVLALPRFSYGRPTSTFTPGSSHLLRKKSVVSCKISIQSFPADANCKHQCSSLEESVPTPSYSA